MLIRTPGPQKENREWMPGVRRLFKTLGLDHGPYAKMPWNIEWPLPNMKRITEYDFWFHCSSWGHVCEAHCTNVRLPTGEHVNVWLFVGGPEEIGYAVLWKYGYPESEGRTEYYTFSACDHDYVSRNIGRCLTEYKCSKCEHKYEVDSSD
jgi:hypothetical protein